MTWATVGITLASFGVSVLAPFIFRPLLYRWGVVDIPSARSSHVATTLRAGGLGPLIGWMSGIGLSATLVPSDVRPLCIVGVTAVLLALLGFVDDLVGLPAMPRLAIQVLLGTAVVAAVSISTGVSTWWVVLSSAVLIVGYVNAANFMDGINGLSGLHGVVVGIAFAVAGFLGEQNWLIAVGLILAAVFGAFLPWNLHRAGFFLGDVGSYLLGGAIAVTAVLALVLGVPALLVLPPLAVYVADTAVTMLRRFARGERIMKAHRTHAYQRLTDTGLSHVAAAVIVTAFAATTSAVGTVVWLSGAAPWMGWLLVAVVCAIYLCVPRWRGSRLPSTGLEVPPAAQIREVPASATRSVARWAVLGGSGFVGSAVVAQLQGQGVDVVAISAPRLRIDKSLAADIDALVSAAASGSELTALAAKLGGADVVINAAGLAEPDSGDDADLYGANALLPVVIALACQAASVGRYIHLSSAAVQGRTAVLDDTTAVAPFSAYSHSKALGERGLLTVSSREDTSRTIILRATSVQGAGRPTTETLIKLARSPLASVAAPGTAPSVTSSITRLASTVYDLGMATSSVPGLVLQPWEGMSTMRVLAAAAPGKSPKMLPPWLCRVTVSIGFALGRVVPRFTGIARRVEVMWFGQAQKPGWGQPAVPHESSELLGILAAGEAR